MGKRSSLTFEYAIINMESIYEFCEMVLLSLLFVKSGEILSYFAHVHFVFDLLTIRSERGSVTEIAQYAESATRPKDVNIGRDATIVNANLWSNAFARPVSPHCATCVRARARSRWKKKYNEI